MDAPGKDIVEQRLRRAPALAAESIHGD